MEVPDEYATLIHTGDTFTLESNSGTWVARRRKWKVPQNLSEGMTLYVYLEKVK